MRTRAAAIAVAALGWLVLSGCEQVDVSITKVEADFDWSSFTLQFRVGIETSGFDIEAIHSAKWTATINGRTVASAHGSVKGGAILFGARLHGKRAAKALWSALKSGSLNANARLSVTVKTFLGPQTLTKTWGGKITLVDLLE